MKYPKYNHYLIFTRTSKNLCSITNYVTEEEWIADVQCVKFLKALDGHTDPHKIDPSLNEYEVDDYVSCMREEGLLDGNKRVDVIGWGSILIPLWYPKIGKKHRILGAIWNRILIISWLPLLVAGINTLLNGSWDYVEWDCGELLGYILGIGLGLFLHELSHAASCIGYGAKCHFFEMGLMLHTFLPGAYVMLDYTKLKNKYKRAQINAAGIECNLVLCGLFLVCLQFEILDSSALILGAALNAVLAIFNTSLLQGLDGMNIFREALGCPVEFVEKAKRLVANQKVKKVLRKKGINGRVTIAACYIIVCFQLLLPIVLLLNIASIVSLILL